MAAVKKRETRLSLNEMIWGMMDLLGGAIVGNGNGNVFGRGCRELWGKLEIEKIGEVDG